ncbi:MAG: hypothetical protein QM831_03125 [Kofleriaceae bacterium]
MVLMMVGLAACTTSLPTNGGGGSNFDPGTVDSGTAGDPLDHEPDPLSAANGFLQGQAQLTALCARGNTDAVSKAFCTGAAPNITSVVELQTLLGLDFKPGNTANGKNGNPAFVLTGHSSSLVTKFTSAINPRAIIFTPPNSTGRVNAPKPLASFIAMGFVRGEQFVELVSNDPATGNLNFFLFKFEQGCNSQPMGCTNDDILTPKVEGGFTGYSLYQDTDIKNTIFDCLQCHQTTGPNTPKVLRMQELQNPWGHFFRNNRSNGQALLADYMGAHDVTEAYAGIPGAAITNSDPAQLEGLVENQGFQAQPNEFTTNKILDQGANATWLALYNKSMMSQDIPPPYHENRVADPAKLVTATAAYKAAMSGTPLTMDIRDVFMDSALQDMSFRPAASLVTAGDGKGIMVQICQQCHNPSLDQTLSRAKFDVTKLDTMSREEKDKAILRLELDESAFRRMPPPRFRGFSQAEIDLVKAELAK